MTTTNNNHNNNHNGHATGATAEMTSAAFAPPPNRLKNVEHADSEHSADLANVTPWKTSRVVAVGLVFVILLVGAFALASAHEASTSTS